MDDLLLDACVMINVAASGVPLRELAIRNGVTFAMERTAAGEVLFLAPAAEGGTRERIDVVGTAERGDLRLVELTPGEPAERVSDVLHRVESRARFIPRRADPYRDWWHEARHDRR